MIDALQCFVAVVDAGNLSAAARSLQLSVSSVSRRIDALEAEWGVPLFHRTSRLVMLTDAGEQFLVHARAILAELAEARSSLSQLETAPRGLLTVTAPAAFGRKHMAPAVADFLTRYPQIELDLQTTDDLVDLVARRVDVAVRIGVPQDSDLKATLLARQQRYVCASPAYLQRHGRPATPLDLLEHNCLKLGARVPPPGWWTFAGVNRQQPLAVRGSLRTDNIDVMLRAAIGGVGIVHLGSWMVADALAAGELVALFGPETHPPGVPQAIIHALRLPGRSHPVKAQLFINHLRDFFGARPYWEAAAALAFSS